VPREQKKRNRIQLYPRPVSRSWKATCPSATRGSRHASLTSCTTDHFVIATVSLDEVAGQRKHFSQNGTLSLASAYPDLGKQQPLSPKDRKPPLRLERTNEQSPKVPLQWAPQALLLDNKPPNREQ
jgi:hypothetical protein